MGHSYETAEFKGNNNNNYGHLYIEDINTNSFYTENREPRLIEPFYFQ